MELENELGLPHVVGPVLEALFEIVPGGIGPDVEVGE